MTAAAGRVNDVLVVIGACVRQQRVVYCTVCKKGGAQCAGAGCHLFAGHAMDSGTGLSQAARSLACFLNATSFTLGRKTAQRAGNESVCLLD